MELFANLERYAREQPDRPAHIGVGMAGTRETLTYRDLLVRAERLAAHLRNALPPDRSPLVVLGHKEPEMLVGFLGAVGSGHPYIPLDDSLPAARIEAVVASAGARLTLTPARIAEICAAHPSTADVCEAAALSQRIRRCSWFVHGHGCVLASRRGFEPLLPP